MVTRCGFLVGVAAAGVVVAGAISQGSFRAFTEIMPNAYVPGQAAGHWLYDLRALS